MERKNKWTLKDKLAGLILIERFYLILFFLIYPLIVLSLSGVNIFFGYIIFFVLGIFLIYYFVISNKILNKKRRYFQIFFPISTALFFFLVLNQIFAFLINFYANSLNIFNLFFFFLSVFFIALFIYNIRNPVILRMNQKYIMRVRGGSDKIHIRINLSLIFLFLILFLVNYIIPVYNFSYPSRERDDFQIGFWTYGVPLDDQPYKDTGLENISNETLDFMGKNGIYIIYGITDEALDSENNETWPSGYLNGNLNFTERLKRCKNFGVKVHLSLTHRYFDDPYIFINIWTIEDTIKDIYKLKELLEAHDLWKDPVDTLVFDIEPVIPYYTSFYGLLNPELGSIFSNMEKLKEYDEILRDFIDFIEIITEDWELNVELCQIGMNLYDKIDGDDDLLRLWGLIDAETNENIQKSYMIYRGSILSQKFLIDSMDMMEENDIVIISGFDSNEFYHDDIDLTINDGQLVKNYPKKNLQLQLWDLYKIIDAYGEENIIKLIKGLQASKSAYYSLSNIYSLINDALYFFYIYIDIFFSGLLFIIKIL